MTSLSHAIPGFAQHLSRTQPASCRYPLGFLGWFSFYFFGPLAHDKVDDPYDMTEAWEEFKFRAAVGEQLAKKDASKDGFVQLAELDQPAPITPANPGPADLGAVLEILGLREKYGQLAEEFKLEALEAMAREDAVYCGIELEKAGVSGGDRVTILMALRCGLPGGGSDGPLVGTGTEPACQVRIKLEGTLTPAANGVDAIRRPCAVDV